jgi:hypothetical protein
MRQEAWQHPHDDKSFKVALVIAPRKRNNAKNPNLETATWKFQLSGPAAQD